MNDDSRTPELDERQALAVSAVLDATATAEERALVDASPELQAWIDRYRRTLVDLADVPIDAVVRDRSVAAALAAFDDVAAAPATAPASVGAGAPVVSLADRARRRWNPSVVLGAAAAMVAVLAIGGVIASNGGGEDNDTAVAPAATMAAADPAAKSDGDAATADASTFSEPVAEMAPAPTIDQIPSAADPITAAGETGSPAGAGDAAPSDSAAPANTEAPADTEAPTALEAPADDEGGSTPASDDVPSTSALDIDDVVTDPDALVDYVARMDAERTTSTTTPSAPPATASATTSPVAECATTELDVVGYVLYGPDEVPAAVVRDGRSTGGGAPTEVSAIALETCQILVVVTL